MEKELKHKVVGFKKSGSGSYTPVVTIPITWLREMGIDKENRSIVVYKDGSSIVIKKDIKCEEK